MKALLGYGFAFIGALIAVFYLGSRVSDSYIAQHTFESPEDVNLYHTFIYLGTILGCVLVGWIIGRLIARIFTD